MLEPTIYQFLSVPEMENPLKSIYNNNHNSMCKDVVYQVFLMGEPKAMNELQNSVIYEYCYEMAMSGFVEINKE